ncbi:MAG TPA: cysteine desulfhydrase, partial [Chloroflexi bacterium]|nr:cysteine desulfhydrase [Chloroflexota bacterium]
MRLSELPRIRLATLPTPLEEAARLSEALGGPRILFKRDDLTGLALGGNKARKLEYLLGEALDQGADVVVTGAGPQSNHVRLTAGAARKLGLDPVLVMYGDAPTAVQGNYLLDHLMGAEFVFTGSADRSSVDGALEEVAADLRRRGR